MYLLVNVCLSFLICWTFPPASLASADLPDGLLDKKTLKSHEPAVVWAKLGDRMHVVSAAEPSSAPILRVNYPKGGWGSKNSGSQIMFAVPPAEKTNCEYLVRFGNNFDFVKGGKLPGLAGGQATSGNHHPVGDGWTARLMWRRGGDAVLYLYHMDQRKKYGDDFSLNHHFLPGKWHHVRQRVTVNHAGKSDGRIEIWFDGELALDQRSLRLREGNQAPVDRFYFSTFFGGQGDQWAPAKDQTIDFAKIKVVASE